MRVLQRLSRGNGSLNAIPAAVLECACGAVQWHMYSGGPAPTPSGAEEEESKDSNVAVSGGEVAGGFSEG